MHIARDISEDMEIELEGHCLGSSISTHTTVTEYLLDIENHLEIISRSTPPDLAGRKISRIR